MPSFKVNRDAIEVDAEDPDSLATTTATALAALERLRATPPTPDKPAAGFRLDQERRTTPTVAPTSPGPYGRPAITPARAGQSADHTKEQQ